LLVCEKSTRASAAGHDFIGDQCTA
jgi:hypothetical protein